MLPIPDSTIIGAPTDVEIQAHLDFIKKSREVLNEIGWAIHRLNYKWWHDKTGAPLDRNVPELLCLMHSEISEAMEGHRKNLPDDKLPHYPMFIVELGDAHIREFDTGAASDHKIGDVIYEKCVYNADRLDHTWEAREAENGKKF